MNNLLQPADPRQQMDIEEMRQQANMSKQPPLFPDYNKTSYKPLSLQQMQAEAELRFAVALLRTGLDHFNGLMLSDHIISHTSRLCADVVRAAKKLDKVKEAEAGEKAV